MSYRMQNLRIKTYYLKFSLSIKLNCEEVDKAMVRYIREVTDTIMTLMIEIEDFPSNHSSNQT